jgi:hypothetical protein
MMKANKLYVKPKLASSDTYYAILTSFCFIWMIDLNYFAACSLSLQLNCSVIDCDRGFLTRFLLDTNLSNCTSGYPIHLS